MKSAALSASYVDHVARLEQRLTTDDALRRAVGGEFIAIGKLEYHLLRSRGLKDDHVVVDVGCGSGRLAYQLAAFPGLRYVGCDVVPRLVEYARELCQRPDWRFEVISGTTIPCENGVADFVCFFSVFTHLHQEEIYRYFREAHRVLKPGGLLVMSFLEFRVSAHWAAFIASVDRTREDQHLNQFIERDAIHAWAPPAGFDVRSIHGGDTAYIPLPEEIVYESGARATGAASLGQSVAILQKRSADPVAAANAGAVAADSSSLSPPIEDNRRAALANVSARSRVPRGGSVTVGFILRGEADRRVLVRAVGPGLAMFGVPDPLARPVVSVMSGERQRAENSGWVDDVAVAAAAVAVGAFPLAQGSADAALIVALPPGSHTAVVTSRDPADEGDVLLEVYLLD